MRKERDLYRWSGWSNKWTVSHIMMKSPPVSWLSFAFAKLIVYNLAAEERLRRTGRRSTRQHRRKDVAVDIAPGMDQGDAFIANDFLLLQQRGQRRCRGTFRYIVGCAEIDPHILYDFAI